MAAATRRCPRGWTSLAAVALVVLDREVVMALGLGPVGRGGQDVGQREESPRRKYAPKDPARVAKTTPE